MPGKLVLFKRILLPLILTSVAVLIFLFPYHYRSWPEQTELTTVSGYLIDPPQSVSGGKTGGPYLLLQLNRIPGAHFRISSAALDATDEEAVHHDIHYHDTVTLSVRRKDLHRYLIRDSLSPFQQIAIENIDVFDLRFKGKAYILDHTAAEASHRRSNIILCTVLSLGLLALAVQGFFEALRKP